MLHAGDTFRVWIGAPTLLHLTRGENFQTRKMLLKGAISQSTWAISQELCWRGIHVTPVPTPAPSPGVQCLWDYPLGPPMAYHLKGHMGKGGVGFMGSCCPGEKEGGARWVVGYRLWECGPKGLLLLLPRRFAQRRGGLIGGERERRSIPWIFRTTGMLSLSAPPIHFIPAVPLLLCFLSQLPSPVGRPCPIGFRAAESFTIDWWMI